MGWVARYSRFSLRSTRPRLRSIPRRLAHRVRLRRSNALRELEHSRGQRIEEGQHFGSLHHIGVFGVHVAQIDGVAGLGAVEAAFLGERDPVVEAEAVEHARAHTPRRGGAGNDDAVAAQNLYLTREAGAKKSRLSLLVDDQIWRAR